MKDQRFKELTDFLVNLGVVDVPHTGKTYMAHVVAVHRLMEAQGCDEDLCRAGLFHSIYSTESFKGFEWMLERRGDVRALIGERAERLAYLNCAMNRASFDQAVAHAAGPYRIVDRITGEEVALTPEEFEDLCKVHLYDWLEQVPRSRYGWGYRRASYRRMAERLGPEACRAYDRVFAAEPVAAPAE